MIGYGTADACVMPAHRSTSCMYDMGVATRVDSTCYLQCRRDGRAALRVVLTHLRLCRVLGIALH